MFGYISAPHAGRFVARRPARRLPHPTLPLPAPPLAQPPGAPQELGWNGIHMNQVSNGWVRNVRVENGDLGVYFW